MPQVLPSSAVHFRLSYADRMRMSGVQARHVGRGLVQRAFALSFLVAMGGACAGQAGHAQEPARQRPAESFACSRDNLTVYTGVVIEYRRAMGQTTLGIRTDWDTTERVTLKHPGTDDPSAFFRLAGRPFNPASDWTQIEQRKGVVRPGARASAWACSDGKVMVDWGVPKE